MKKKNLITLAAVVVVVAGILAWWYSRRECIEERSHTAYHDPFDISSYQSKTKEVHDEPDYVEWDEFVWKGPEPDEECIRQFLNKDTLYDYLGSTFDLSYIGFINYISHPSYAIDISNRNRIVKHGRAKFILNDIFSYTARKNDLLLSMYARFRGTLFSMLSREDFIELGILDLMRRLDIAYDYYEGENGLNTDLLRNTYYTLCGRSDIEAEFPTIPGEDEDGEIVEVDGFWEHSFWARRYAENNIEAVRAILNDLWAHYMEDAEAVVYKSWIHEDSLPTDEQGNYIYELYHDNDTLDCTYAYGPNGKRTGRWKYYWAGVIYQEGEMENGMMKEHIFYDDGILYSKSLFVNDTLLSGSCYDSDNKLNRTESYDWSDGKVTEYTRHWNHGADGDTIIKKSINGKTEGAYIVKYAGGNLKTEANYVGGLLDGEHKTYYPNGQLHKHTYFEKGRYAGTFLSYYDSGEIKQRGTFEEGFLKGDYFFYEKNGEVKVVQYKAGEKVSGN